MSRLKQRIDQLYRKVFDDFVPRRDVSDEELAALDTEFEELLASVTTPQADGAR